MGEAKRRGSRDARAAEAIERNQIETARRELERQAAKELERQAKAAKMAAMEPEQRQRYQQRQRTRNLNVAWMVGLVAALIPPPRTKDPVQENAHD